ncbi:uncharacterized protein DMAD_04867 [Drosophila madeirensis]|uniref:Uncharacterized protein n=1 Tax=Drosophila madeirensis TaxID=30013 RepID=A0AAU9GC64_DROMD
MKICLFLLLLALAAAVDYSIDHESNRHSFSHTDEDPDEDNSFEDHAALYMRGNDNRCGMYKDYKVCAIKHGMEITKAKGKTYKFYFRKGEQQQQVKFYKELVTLEHHRHTVLITLPSESNAEDEFVIARTTHPKRLYAGTRFGFNVRDQITLLEPPHNSP